MLNSTKSGSGKKSFSFIDEAYRSFRKKNYDNAVIILEKGYASGETNPYALFLLSVSLIYSNNFSRAGIILEHIQRVDPFYEPFVQLKSFLSLKSAISREEAMHVYVAALEKLPSDRMLRKALRILEETKVFTSFQKNVKLHELVDIPPPGKKQRTGRISSSKNNRLRYRRRYTIPGIIFVSAGIVFVILIAMSPFYFSSLMKKLSGDGQKSSASDISVKVDMVDVGGAGYGIIDRISTDKTPEFYASGDIVITDFNEARRLLKKGDFNKGIIILNRIINSNASFMVKEKCEFLIKYVMDSDERIYEEIDISMLNQKPYLYRGSSVKISGRVANIKKVRGGVSFTLMVGYDGNNFKGITMVFYPKDSVINNGDMVTVNGLYITGMGKGNVPYISGEELTKLNNIP